MWWQVLPPMGIIGGCCIVQFSSMGIITYVFTGRPTHRGLTEGTYFSTTQKLAYQRDTYNVGNEYENRGLECIEDE